MRFSWRPGTSPLAACAALLIAACSTTEGGPAGGEQPDAATAADARRPRADAAVASSADAAPADAALADARPSGGSPDAAPSTPDAMTTPDAAPAPVQDPLTRLTPDNGWKVASFAMGPQDMALRVFLGTSALWRCPVGGCPAQPKVIAMPLASNLYGIGISGADAYYLQGDLVPSMQQVPLSGIGDPEAVAESPLYSSFSTTVAAARGRLYVGFVDVTKSFGILEVDATGAFAIRADGTASIAGEVAADDDWLVLAPRANPSSAAHAFILTSFVDAEQTPTAPIVFDGDGRALAVAGDNLFWAQDDTLKGCSLLDGCKNQVTVRSGIQDLAIATDGARVYFAAFAERTGTIQSCPAEPAACATPRLHSRNFNWLLPRQLYVDSDYIYGIDQENLSVWRADK